MNTKRLAKKLQGFMSIENGVVEWSSDLDLRPANLQRLHGFSEYVHRCIYNDMRPDNYTYQFIWSALRTIADGVEPDTGEWESRIADVVNFCPKTAWLGSSLSRVAAVDEVLSKGRKLRILEVIRQAQENEVRRVFRLVLSQILDWSYGL